MSTTSSNRRLGPRGQLFEPNRFLFAQVERTEAIPPAVRHVCTSITDDEATFTAHLEMKVKDAWHTVESMLERNRSRVHRLETEVDAALDDMDSVTFWTVDGVREQFMQNNTEDETSSTVTTRVTTVDGAAGCSELRSMLSSSSIADALHTPLRSDDNPASVSKMLSKQLSLSKIRLKKDHRSTLKSNGEAARDLVGDSVSGAHHAAPLRRLFRDMLSRRRELPKELTILLNRIESMQKKELPALESQLEESSLEVPIHVPLARVALLLHRAFTKPSRGALEEDAFLSAMRPLLNELDESYASLRGLWNAEDMTSTRKADATEAMWTSLLTELATRKDVHQDCDVILESVALCERELSTILSSSMETCREQIERDFREIEADASTVEGSATATLAQAEAAKGALEVAHREDRMSIDTALQGVKFQISSSLQAQEKCARRVREAYKELHREQIKHEQLVANYLHLKTVSKQVDASAAQLHGLVASKLERASAAKSTSSHLQTIITSTRDACNTLLLECEQHAARVNTEEYFRKCRVVGYAADNLAKWLRCANDVASLYAAREEAVRTKSDSSWQLAYLLTHERQRCLGNLEAVRNEVRVIDKAWESLQDRLRALQLPIPNVDRMDRTEDAAQMRMVLASIDDDSVVSKVGAKIADIAALSRAGEARKLWAELLEAHRKGTVVHGGIQKVADKKKPESARLPASTVTDEGSGVLLPRIPSRSTSSTPRPPHRDLHQVRRR